MTGRFRAARARAAAQGRATRVRAAQAKALRTKASSGWIPFPRRDLGWPRTRLASPARDQVFMTAMWQLVVALGGPFVPVLPTEHDEDPLDAEWAAWSAEWSDPR